MGRLQGTEAAVRSRDAAHSSGAGRMRAALLAMQGAFTLYGASGRISLPWGAVSSTWRPPILGFRTENVITLNASLSGTRWDAEKRTAQYYDEGLARLRAIPGVESAAVVGYLPLMDNIYGATALDLDPTHGVSGVVVNSASPDYSFPRHGNARPRRPRIHRSRTRSNSGHAPAIVNQEFAARLGVGPHLAGKTITAQWPKGRIYTIVGVVQTEMVRGPNSALTPQIFFPATQYRPAFATFVA